MMRNSEIGDKTVQVWALKNPGFISSHLDLASNLVDSPIMLSSAETLEVLFGYAWCRL